MDLSRFTIPSNTEKRTILKIHNSRLVKLRFAYVTILCGVAAAASILAGLSNEEALKYVLIWALALPVNAFFYLINNFLAKTVNQFRVIMVLQIVLDLSVAAYVVYDQGGINARATVLFALPIIAAGLLFSARTVYGTAVLAGVAYILSILFASDAFMSGVKWHESLVPLIFYPIFFLILATLVVYLARFNERYVRKEAYDAFLSLLTHQLLHPASAVASIIDVIEHQKYSTPAKQNEYIKMLKSENQQLLFLLNNLIETAANISTNLGSEKIDLTKFLSAAGNQIAGVNDRSGDLVLQVPEGLTVFGNKSKLDIALRNLVDNSFRYSEKGSPVKITAQAKDKIAEIVIEDSGVGMSDRVKKSAFEKYNAEALQSNQGVRGLGLGLFVAQKVINAHKGSLEILSIQNVGTRVIIKLKLKKEP